MRFGEQTNRAQRIVKRISGRAWDSEVEQAKMLLIPHLCETKYTQLRPGVRGRNVCGSLRFAKSEQPSLAVFCYGVRPNPKD
jgi:hypothetical protein